MPYETQWYIPGAIIYTHAWGTITEDDLRQMILQNVRLCTESDRREVHSITDLSDVEHYPSFVQIMKIATEIKPTANAGWSITVGEKDPKLKLLAQMLRQVFRVRLYTFDTLQDALALLKRMDHTINWDQAVQTILNMPTDSGVNSHAVDRSDV